MKIKKVEYRPRYYTDKEGGIFKKWQKRFGKVTEAKLKKAQKQSVFILPNGDVTQINGIQVHSMLIEIIKGQVMRWDVISGWNNQRGKS